MNKRVRNIFIIIGCCVIGGIVGYIVVKTQQLQLQDPEYLEIWRKNNMPIPEPISFRRAISGFAILFGGIPSGLMIFKFTVNKFVLEKKGKLGWILLAGIVLFPIYTVIGSIGIIPVLVFQVMMFRLNK